jgi:hypothetical protein
MCFQRNIYLLLRRLETRRCGARCRRRARYRKLVRNSSGEGSRRSGEHHIGRMAQWRGRMAGRGAGTWWRGRIAAGRARWRVLRRRGHTGAHTRWRVQRRRGHTGARAWQFGHGGGAVNGEERTTQGDMVWDERILKWRVGPLGWCRGLSMKTSEWTDVLSTALPISDSIVVGALSLL